MTTTLWTQAVRGRHSNRQLPGRSARAVTQSHRRSTGCRRAAVRRRSRPLLPRHGRWAVRMRERRIASFGTVLGSGADGQDRVAAGTPLRLPPVHGTAAAAAPTDMGPAGVNDAPRPDSGQLSAGQARLVTPSGYPKGRPDCGACLRTVCETGSEFGVGVKPSGQPAKPENTGLETLGHANGASICQTEHRTSTGPMFTGVYLWWGGGMGRAPETRRPLKGSNGFAAPVP